MGVTHGTVFGSISAGHDNYDDHRDVSRLDANMWADAYRDTDYLLTGSLPLDAIETLRLHFDATSVSSSQERTMDIKAVLAALETAGIQITTQNVAPLAGQLITLAVAAAEKGISDLSHKAGVQDVTKAQ